MKTYQELCALSKDELNKEPCKCVSCPTCRGTGKLSVPDPLNEPFDDLITCDECDEGIIEECDRCQLMGELLHEELE